MPKAYGLELVGGELELIAFGLWHRAHSLELIVYGFELIVYGLDLKKLLSKIDLVLQSLVRAHTVGVK